MTRWNIFARELEDILADRGLRLSQLDDRTFIHREKVRRLRKSLLYPKSFPVLNIEEMEEVISIMRLDTYEVLRLRAAIIAASIQEMLVERIDADNAYIATEQIFPALMQALEDHRHENRGLATMRNDTLVIPAEIKGEPALEPALTLFDKAIRALHLNRNADTHVEHLELLHQAIISHNLALKSLSNLDEQVKQTDAWHFWHSEIEHGLLAANQLLREEETA